jgi:hypothetical protein
MQISILQGTYTDAAPDFRVSYPVNMCPISQGNGISAGYLRPGEGIDTVATGPGVDRGGITWLGVHYRVMGGQFVQVDETGAITQLGAIAGTAPCIFDYGFDRLAIAGGGNLYYWDGGSLNRVTDPDLGVVNDVVWVDGYFMTTDGTSLVVTELNDPTAVNPLKYGSSEADPDPVLGLFKIRNEVYALNRHTIELFTNTGGSGFPFARVEGAQVMKGVIGTNMACTLQDVMAFVGSGRNEAIGIHVATNGASQKVSTDEIDRILATYTDAELASGLCESRVIDGRTLLYVHLPDRCIVYDATASKDFQRPIWYTLTSTIEGFATYRARGFVLAYGKWWAGDPTSYKLGTMSMTHAENHGDKVRWEFGTQIIYNAGKGAIVFGLELACLTGRAATDAQISTSYTDDGLNWSQDKYVRVGKYGDRLKRIQWLQNGHMRNWRAQRFQGTSDAFISVARLEAQLEPMGF